MEQTKKRLEEGTPERCYLLTGTEPFLIKMMKGNFLKYLCGGDKNAINYLEYKDAETLPQGKDLVAECMAAPMFAPFKLIVINECLKKDDIFVDFLPQIPETTVVVIISKDIDKRGKLYKAIKKYGYICECEPYSQNQLNNWVKRVVARCGCTIGDVETKYLINYVGTEMNTLVNEISKLSMIVTDFTREAIKEYCFPKIENKVFDMITNAINGEQKNAAKQYEELLALKESPYKILCLINRQLRILMVVQAATGTPDSELAKLLGIHPFVVRKNKGCRYNVQQLQELLQLGLDYDTQIKSGKISDKLAVEMFLCQIAA